MKISKTILKEMSENITDQIIDFFESEGILDFDEDMNEDQLKNLKERISDFVKDELEGL